MRNHTKLIAAANRFVPMHCFDSEDCLHESGCLCHCDGCRKAKENDNA